ncbi:MAG: type I DNA topoisomerase [Pseudomonadota bacterium]
MTILVIVESPAKAKTISRFLGPEYVVEASYGHIRDLPDKATEIPEAVKKEKWARLGVNVERDFEPLYIIPEDKKKHVQRLKKALKDADELLLATDEDREGESICWHLVEVLKPKVPVRRIAFHEITKAAILAAVEHPGQVLDNLVRAQESRRILDRLFGYRLSPVLWKKVKRGLSAGRVQSVAVKLCVERERERRAFVTAGYFGIDAELGKDGRSFSAKLNRIGEQRVAVGNDFDGTTGLPGSKVLWVRSEDEAKALIEAMARPFRVRSVDEKPSSSQPSPPFTTATLQQEANRKLGFSARHTMRVAQHLYEGVDLDGERVGVITYMRTDSVNLSELALGEAEQVVRDLYGADYTKGPRRYRTQSAGAQEAHEAIRPTELHRTPQSLESFLDRDELRLYELIWKRTLASQMTDARMQRTSVELLSVLGDGREALFGASGKRIEFPGFLRAYVEGADDPAADIADKETLLPALSVGEQIDPAQVTASAHETQPPARYTEASLVKKLEAEGIGRPSTYAAIIDTIQDRGYVEKQGKALVPTFTAFAVNQVLEQHFGDYVDLRFTARMERQLDDIADGGLDYLQHLRSFYHGNGDGLPGLNARIETAEPKIEFPVVMIGQHPQTGQDLVVKIGRYGPYLQMGTGEGDERVIAPLPAKVAPADLSVEQAVTILEQKQRGPRCVGTDPDTGLSIYVANGRFGPYVQLGENPTDPKADKPKRASLAKDMTEDSVDLAQALVLLSLPRVLGVHPESGEEITASVSRFGPFVRVAGSYRSLEADDDVYTIELPRALEILAQPPKKRQQATKKVLRELGLNGESGEKITLLEGRYGPYVTDGTRNASLPRNTEVENFDLEQAIKLLQTKGKAPKRSRRRRAG